MNAYQLANLAGVACPDSVESPGAQFLRGVESAAEDVADPDDVGEVADGCVPVYTHERWQVFVDLAAFNEDPSELGGDSADLTQAAGVALYMIAERLLAVLLEVAR